MTARQEEFLKKIIENYIQTGEPVGSKSLILQYNLKISSATVRSEMASLEKNGYLEKSHTSSGRIPSTIGYKYYAKKLATNTSDKLINKLNDVFSERRVSIDFTIAEAAKAISEIAGLTLVTSNSDNDELMKSIQLTPIDDKMATIVIVTSSGRAESKLIEINSFTTLEDIRIALRLFKERLIDTKLKDLSSKVESLTPILKKSVKNYESLIKAFVSKVFDYHEKVTNKVYGNTNIVKSDIKREDLANLLELIETKSVFQSLEGELDEDVKMKIDIRPNNTSLLSTKVRHHNTSTEISIVGPNRMDYSDAKKAIEMITKYIKGEK